MPMTSSMTNFNFGRFFFLFLHFVLLLCQFHIQSTKAFSISTSNTIAASSLHVDPLYTRLNCKSVSVRPGWILGISVCGLNPLLVALQKPKWALSCDTSPRRFRCAQAFTGTCAVSEGFRGTCSHFRCSEDHFWEASRRAGRWCFNQCYFPSPDTGDAFHKCSSPYRKYRHIDNLPHFSFLFVNRTSPCDCAITTETITY